MSASAADERARLRALAEKATPGPWKRWDGYLSVHQVTEQNTRGSMVFTEICECDDECNTRAHHDVEYIASASPDAVLRLLDDVERLERDLVQAKEAVQTLNAGRPLGDVVGLHTAQNAIARAERLEAALRAVLAFFGEAWRQDAEPWNEARAALAEPAPGGQDAEREGGA